MGRVKQYAKKTTGGKASSHSVAHAYWSLSGMCSSQHHPLPFEKPYPYFNITFFSNSAAESGQKGEAPKVVSYDVSYESVFFQHYFDTGSEKEKLFAPSYRCVMVIGVIAAACIWCRSMRWCIMFLGYLRLLIF